VKVEEPVCKIPSGDDWIIISFCLVPWEAKNITMFLNFDTLVKTNMTIKSLKRVIEGKIGSVSSLSLYLNPPNKEEPLNFEECQNYRLIDIDCNGGTYENPARSILFFDFNPSYPHFGNEDLGIDPLLLAEPSQILMNQSEKVKEEASSLFKMIRSKSKVKKHKPQKLAVISESTPSTGTCDAASREIEIEDEADNVDDEENEM